ncbi:MAG: inorganic phosphate transporter [Bacillota bacterium]
MFCDLWLIATVVALALAFDFVNGFHDTANAIASPISTRALNPRFAVLLAAVMNFVGALTFTGVAKTIGGKIADPMKLEAGLYIVLAALIAAIFWNLVTWYFGMPSSSSHALIGALAGAVVAAAGFSAVNAGGFTKIIASLILSPLVAATVGYTLMNLVRIIFANANPHRINNRFRRAQLFTAAFQAFTHGTNDAQKTMGIITFALVAGGFQDTLEVALWVKIAAALAMALGTYSGGWRIIKTVGTRIFPLRPSSGFSADFGSAITILTATLLSQPVSTTHVISSSIVGVGLARRSSSVKWTTTRNMVTTWVFTIPATAVVAALSFELLRHIFNIP